MAKANEDQALLARGRFAILQLRSEAELSSIHGENDKADSIKNALRTTKIDK